MNVRFVSAAETEFADAASFYEEAEPGLGEEFVLEVLSAVDQLRRLPMLGKSIAARVRSLAIHRFPFKVIYKSEAAEVVIVAIAHQSRRPGYWIDRIAS
jgi:plasmid stabilization system protein ParE